MPIAGRQTRDRRDTRNMYSYLIESVFPRDDEQPHESDWPPIDIRQIPGYQAQECLHILLYAIAGYT